MVNACLLVYFTFCTKVDFPGEAYFSTSTPKEAGRDNNLSTKRNSNTSQPKLFSLFRPAGIFQKKTP